ncbi:MAG: hypothetical protein H7Z41_05575 [Cytophagales bacterium]|nr:hypothetical protein [Armatimonadota bacterium]
MAKTYDSKTAESIPSTGATDSSVTVSDSGRKGGATSAALSDSASSVRAYNADEHNSGKSPVQRWLPLLIAALVLFLAVALGSRLLNRAPAQNGAETGAPSSASQGGSRNATGAGQ